MARLLPLCAACAGAYAVVLCLAALSAPAPAAFLAAPAPGRREAVQGAAAVLAAAVGGEAALADFQGEPVTCMKRYGPAIIKLQSAVDSGDMKAVLAKENKFKMLNTFWRNQPKDFAAQTEVSEDLLDAAADGQVDKVKTLYAKYMEKTELKTFANLPPARQYHMTNRDASMGKR
ncbi:unnamed protein product [Prorocentrum cordatum]|uniref:Photosystem II Psb31 protein domain-containing protein n=1 Tax=Prorocentrum cordatum TaxID=2364126 RepID=A0ABN9SR43_9DINO|nr:unnamed protein product [Polarella glacialis]